jgi:hypothetical protein
MRMRRRRGGRQSEGGGGGVVQNDGNKEMYRISSPSVQLPSPREGRKERKKKEGRNKGTNEQRKERTKEQRKKGKKEQRKEGRNKKERTGKNGCCKMLLIFYQQFVLWLVWAPLTVEVPSKFCSGCR